MTRGPALGLLLGLALLALAPGGAGRAEERRPNEPYVGFAYPAGGRRGATFRVAVGGLNLRSASAVHVTGAGVRAEVIRHLPPWRPLDREEAAAVRGRLAELRAAKASGARGGAAAGATPSRTDPPATAAPRSALPDHPFLAGLERMSLEELKEVEDWFFRPRPVQAAKRAIAETVHLRVTIDPDAEAGWRDLRVRTAAGLTNPLRFRVGAVAEVVEAEPNDGMAAATLAPLLPAVLNGQVLAQDVDWFRFPARAGEHLVLRAEARSLIPYQADAVPGWMQATLALHDGQGRRLEFVDEWRFDPDPVLFFEVPEDGDYLLEVRDALHRGREDFVYRVTVGETPFVTRASPLGGQAGEPLVAALYGWNLPWDRVPLDTSVPGPGIRQAVLRQGQDLSNDVPYAVDPWPSVEEEEPNDALPQAQRVVQSRVVGGRVWRPGDVDVFRFEGRAGAEVVAEVHARALGSPLDSVLRLTDAAGAVLAWNDDAVDPELGLLTHHADSRLRARLPRDGPYFLHLSDGTRHGGVEYAYRLRIGPPRPDFALRVTPSSLNAAAGRAALLTVHVARKDGFAGEVEVALAGAPAGFVLSGARVPAGSDRVRLTLTVPEERAAEPVPLRLVGRAKIAGTPVEREAVPAEDMMQAFAYRHLVPFQGLLVTVLGGGRGTGRVLPPEGRPLRVPGGGTARARLPLSARVPFGDLRFEADDPPEGVSLAGVTEVPGALVVEVRADAEPRRLGTEDNLIVNVFLEPAPDPKAGPAAERRRVFLGVLPAVPFEVVRRP